MRTFTNDMKRCGIRVSTEESGPVGVARLPNGFSLRVTPGRCYYVVRITPEIPADVVEVVNNRRHIENGGGYSTHDGRLGGLARAHGFAGGLFGDALQRYGCGHVDHWHVDAIGALDALVDALRTVIVNRDITAEGARRSLCAAHTARWIKDCEPVLRGTGKAAAMIRENLHEDDTLDAADPRIVALRAEFPVAVDAQTWPPKGATT